MASDESSCRFSSDDTSRCGISRIDKLYTEFSKSSCTIAGRVDARVPLFHELNTRVLESLSGGLANTLPRGTELEKPRTRRRHLRNCRLAHGESLLVSAGRYSTSVRRRRRKEVASQFESTSSSASALTSNLSLLTLTGGTIDSMKCPDSSRIAETASEPRSGLELRQRVSRSCSALDTRSAL